MEYCLEELAIAWVWIGSELEGWESDMPEETIPATQPPERLLNPGQAIPAQKS
jgi:hypothetical protein